MWINRLASYIIGLYVPCFLSKSLRGGGHFIIKFLNATNILVWLGEGYTSLVLLEGENRLVIAKVNHSQTMTEKPLRPWYLKLQAPPQ